MVVLADHLKCGVNLPLSSILYSLLAFYGIQLYHVAPNSVIFLSVFVNLCEGFLRIHLDLDLFHHFFILKTNSYIGDPNEVQCFCQFSSCPSKKVKGIQFIVMSACDSWSYDKAGLAKQWFIISGTTVALGFINECMPHSDRWGEHLPPFHFPTMMV